MIKFKTHIEVEIEVEAYICPHTRQTRHDPGNPEYIEDLSVKLIGKIEDYINDDDIQEEALAWAAEEKAEYQAKKLEWQQESDQEMAMLKPITIRPDKLTCPEAKEA